jgi:polysaccharide biosynthesis/export protein
MDARFFVTVNLQSFMSITRVHAVLVAALVTGAVAGSLRLGAQSLPTTLPTPAQARDLIDKRPELVAVLRQRIHDSGLTQEQIVARLRAAGYDETLLEQILGTAKVAGPGASGDSLILAVRALGIIDEVDAGALRRRTMGSADSTRGGHADTSRFDRSRDGRALFGYELFAQSTTLFDPNAAGPVDASYRLGAGDQLVLILSGDVEAAYTLDVTREGFVVVPVIGTVPVANLTLGQLDALLRSRLGRVYSGIGNTTRFSVSVARLRSNQVFVAGDVRLPGSYRISSAGTALTALYAAGGPAERGSLRQVEIRRRGQPVQRFDVYDYLVKGDASGDVRLEQGDVVFVPAHGPRVRVTGGVLRPATYELRPGESMQQLVEAAGGFTDDASVRRLRIERIVPAAQRTGEGSDRILLDVELPSPNTLAGVKLEAGDVIDVPTVAERVRRRITVKGNVWQAGSQGIVAGTTLADALRMAGGLKPDSYLGRVLISRLRTDSTRELLSAPLLSLDGNTAAPILLLEDDEVTVFAMTEFRADLHVSLSGAVRLPGRYPYRQGMTMRDLVLMAGGLLPSASLIEAEIARLPERRVEGRLAETFRVPLDSTFLVAQGDLGNVSADVTLQPYDNVLILQQPDWQLQWSVALTGEVRFPGVYALTSKNERILDVINRAGGLTSAAYPSGVQFVRGAERARVGVELASVLKNAGDRDNLLLQDRDSIHIPRYNALVNVTGAVNSPMSVPYEPGKSLDHYIRAAGGTKREADAKRSYVQQSNGKVVTRRRSLLVFTSVPAPSPGSRVVVPSRDPADKRDLSQLLGTTAQVFGSLVTIIIVLSRRN